MLINNIQNTFLDQNWKSYKTKIVSKFKILAKPVLQNPAQNVL